MRPDVLPAFPLPGRGATAERFRMLAELARTDLVTARLAEGHADALAILTELGYPLADPGGERWGVWAADPITVRAEHRTGRWYLTGDQPWCAGAGWCTDALVTAADGADTRLFAVRNEPPGAEPVDGTWPAVGMAGGDCRSVRFTGAAARPVGGPGDYTNRPGYWHGAIEVAACWYGGALGVASALYTAVREKHVTQPHALAHLGAIDAALHAARTVLAEAAAEIDADPTRDRHRLALRVRATVEATAAEVLQRVGRALGADPLGRDAEHARRVADLTVYLRAGDAETDLEQLGRLAADQEPAW